VALWRSEVHLGCGASGEASLASRLCYLRRLWGTSPMRVALLLIYTSCSLLYDNSDTAIDGSVAPDNSMDSSSADSSVVDGPISDAAPENDATASGDAAGNGCENLFEGQPDVELVCGGGALPDTCLVAFSPADFQTCDDLCEAAGSPSADPCANSFRTGLFTCDSDGFHGCALLSTESLPPLCECNKP